MPNQPSKAVVVETPSDEIIELIIDCLKSRLAAYKRQNHSILLDFQAALETMAIVDNEGTIIPVDLDD